MIKKGRSFCID